MSVSRCCSAIPRDDVKYSDGEGEEDVEDGEASGGGGRDWYRISPALDEVAEEVRRSVGVVEGDDVCVLGEVAAFGASVADVVDRSEDEHPIRRMFGGGQDLLAVPGPPVAL